MAFSFAGGVTTDNVTISYTTDTSPKAILITFLRNGAGGGSAGRLFSRTNGTAIEELFWNGSLIEYRRTYSGNAQSWSIAGTDAASTLYRVGISHSGTRSTLPLFFVNGAAATATIVSSTASNIFSAASANIIVGNRAANDRAWDGWIAEFAYYSAALDSKFTRGYSAGWSPLILPAGNRVVFLPLVRDASDLQRNATILTGATSTSSHPPMFNPSRF